MGSSSSQVSAVGSRQEPYDRVSHLPEHWRLARAAHVDLLLMGVPRVNLILIAPEGVVRYVLESDLLDLRAPVVQWSPGEALDLRPFDRIGTLILHDLGNLPRRDQLALLEWLERADGRVQVVGTSATPLLPRVTGGEFIDTLYYRLNTVCVDVTG